MFHITELSLGRGLLGIAPAPGRGGQYQADLIAVLKWEPALVLTMTTAQELSYVGATSLGHDLRDADVAWHHLPVPDLGTPPEETATLWPDTSERAHAALAEGGRVLAHCYGGCGRSGMALMRLMVEAGEAPNAAVERLRAVRPCAVESPQQYHWAAGQTYG